MRLSSSKYCDSIIRWCFRPDKFVSLNAYYSYKIILSSWATNNVLTNGHWSKDVPVKSKTERKTFQKLSEYKITPKNDSNIFFKKKTEPKETSKNSFLK